MEPSCREGGSTIEFFRTTQSPASGGLSAEHIDASIESEQPSYLFADFDRMPAFPEVVLSIGEPALLGACGDRSFSAPCFQIISGMRPLQKPVAQLFPPHATVGVSLMLAETASQ
jgi:hypothetical protein